jgi:predicted lipoprotein with Yx(FWY)xxD motif
MRHPAQPTRSINVKKSISALGLMIAAFGFTATATYAAGEPAMTGTTTAGKAWVDAKGMALYTFDKDTATKSNCNGKCATEWPPLPVLADATASGDWTIITRDDGSKMWAYKGHPLYTFIDDKKAGQVTGDGQDGFHLAKVVA